MELTTENIEKIATYIYDIAREYLSLDPEYKIDIFIKGGELEHSDPDPISQNVLYPKGAEVIYTLEGSFFENTIKNTDRRKVVAIYLGEKGTLPVALEKKINENRKELIEYAEGTKDFKEISPEAQNTVDELFVHFMLDKLYNEVYGDLTDIVYEKNYEER